MPANSFAAIRPIERRKFPIHNVIPLAPCNDVGVIFHAGCMHPKRGISVACQPMIVWDVCLPCEDCTAPMAPCNDVGVILCALCVRCARQKKCSLCEKKDAPLLIWRVQVE